VGFGLGIAERSGTPHPLFEHLLPLEKGTNPEIASKPLTRLLLLCVFVKTLREKVREAGMRGSVPIN